MWFRKKRKPGPSIKPRQSRLFLKILGLLIILGSAFAVFYLLSSNFFIVKGLEVNKERADCVSADQIKSSSQILGKNIFLLDKDSIETRLKKSYICIGTISLSVKLPDHIKINVLGRGGAFQLITLTQTESSGSATLDNFLKKESSGSAELEQIGDKLIIDDSGTVFAKGEDSNLPILYLSEVDLKVGSSIDKNIFENLKLAIEGTNTLGINPSVTKIYSNRYLLLSAEPKLIFDLSGNIKLQLASLQLILSQAKIEEREMEFIDLRFANPVVKYLPKEKN